MLLEVEHAPTPEVLRLTQRVISGDATQSEIADVLLQTGESFEQLQKLVALYRQRAAALEARAAAAAEVRAAERALQSCPAGVSERQRLLAERTGMDNAELRLSRTIPDDLRNRLHELKKELSAVQGELNALARHERHKDRSSLRAEFWRKALAQCEKDSHFILRQKRPPLDCPAEDASQWRLIFGTPRKAVVAIRARIAELDREVSRASSRSAAAQELQARRDELAAELDRLAPKKFDLFPEV
jgi:hypothetical protein